MAVDPLAWMSAKRRRSRPRLEPLDEGREQDENAIADVSENGADRGRADPRV
jgi:hypothetical protein